jgi:hypothetical protein
LLVVTTRQRQALAFPNKPGTYSQIRLILLTHVRMPLQRADRLVHGIYSGQYVVPESGRSKAMTARSERGRVPASGGI